MAKKLKDRKIVLRLSDPWDLGKQLGWSELEAIIVSVKDDGGVPISIAIKLVSPFDYKNTSCEYFIASPRLGRAGLAGLLKGQAVFCGLTRVASDQIVAADPFDLSHWRGGIGLIGEVELR